MAHAPMYFIISAYLMQAALKDNSPNVMTMILSFLILIFALNLVFAALWKKLSEGYLHFTHRIASALSLIGIAVFTIDLLTIIANLTKAGVNGFVTTLFLALGLLLMLGIAVFYLISIPPQD
jgi:hypothetical protein